MPWVDYSLIDGLRCRHVSSFNYAVRLASGIKIRKTTERMCGRNGGGGHGYSKQENCPPPCVPEATGTTLRPSARTPGSVRAMGLYEPY